MPRHMGARARKADRLYRALVETFREDGTLAWDEGFGPYVQLSAAKGMATREGRKNWRKRDGWTVKARVQWTEADWKDVEG